jgi:ABC-2 type transport system permease protein
MKDRTLLILFRKEWRQLTSSMATLAPAALMPALMLGVIPQIMMRIPPPDPAKVQASRQLHFGVFGDVGSDPTRVALNFMPLLVAMAGLLAPTVMASYLLITERERRTLELLVALPVRIEQVIQAKLLAVLSVTSAFTVPLLVLDLVMLRVRVGAPMGEIAALPVLLVTVVAYSTALSLLLGVLSPDFRTANNLGGALILPSMLLTLAVGFLVPGSLLRALALSALYLLGAALLARAAMRTATFERLLR